jgi:hypothetical protein
METVINQRTAKIFDFFYLQAPKPLSPEFKIKIVVCFLISFPLAKLLLRNGLLAFAILGLISFFLFLFWYKPRADKQTNFNNRVAPETLNNWLLESFKTKILNRAIQYLELETKDFKPEQFIIIPYPVFHSTKKIMDDQILRVKTEYYANKKSETPEVSYFNYSFWNIQILILSKNYVSYYFCSYNWLKDEILNEKSNEYFYQDIALIKTSHEDVNFVSKWHEQPIMEARLLKLIHYSGDVLQLIAEIPELEQSPQTIVDIEKIEKTMRILMRHVRAKDESKKQVDIEFSQATTLGETVEM